MGFTVIIKDEESNIAHTAESAQRWTDVTDLFLGCLKAYFPYLNHEDVAQYILESNRDLSVEQEEPDTTYEEDEIESDRLFDQWIKDNAAASLGETTFYPAHNVDEPEADVNPDISRMRRTIETLRQFNENVKLEIETDVALEQIRKLGEGENEST